MAVSVRVLIADDQPAFRRAAQAVLRTIPAFEVVAEAGSGEEAVELANMLEPDLVLIDVNMDGIGGIEATRRLVAVHPATVAVLVSTREMDDLPADARSCGAAAYLHKERFEASIVRALWEARGDPEWRS